MTLRELFDSFTSSPATAVDSVVPPTTSAPHRSIEIRIDNPHGVPAHYALAGLRRSGRPVTHVDVAELRVGVPTRRSIQLPLTEASIAADHLITIRAAGRTSKLFLYQELLVEWLKGTAPDVRVSIAATGSVSFSVRRPAPRPGVA